ncbi:hypothetical protein FA95DRAFT_305272 [Auriscalpium vulgare]|uniref:Uncharacterized protein n=1 Tax=Auriscalpium vulgare TaxID=40419 RepID=A0ACB8RJF4_9AGAM|nr:hypothetical protein FA95DRAFT_305272 [Auriscalpium vulgare]
MKLRTGYIVPRGGENCGASPLRSRCPYADQPSTPASVPEPPRPHPTLHPCQSASAQPAPPSVPTVPRAPCPPARMRRQTSSSQSSLK